MASIRLRAATPNDAVGIVSTFREAWAESVVAISIYGVNRAAEFIAATIAATADGGDSAFWVATDAAEAVVGFIQLRRGLSAAVLNELHVRPASQNSGVGTHLLTYALEESPQCERILVDVHEDSTRAMAFYQKLGFVADRDGTVWFTCPRPPHDAAPYVVRGLPQADVIHAAFDLSQLQVETGQGVYDIGRMGHEWFRISEASALRDDGLLTALEALGTHRKILSIISGDGSDSVQATRVLASHRLSAAARLVRTTLAKADPPSRWTRG